MSVVAVGLSQRTVPIALLERMTVADDALPKALAALLQTGTVSEAVVLSTCLRTEVYAVVDRFHEAVADVRDWLGGIAGADPEALSDHLYAYYEDQAAAHLFEVAAGLDSAVLGEGEVLSQVRNAWERAREHASAGPVLSGLFRHAVAAGKRARAETGIARGITSLGQAAVAYAVERVGELGGRPVLVIGAGEIGTSVARALARAGAEVAVANRTPERAAALAHGLGGRAVAMAELRREIARADAVFTATAAPSVVIEAADLQAAAAGRDGRPLLVVDVAVPRDVDPGAGEVEGVVLADMEDVSALARDGISGREAEVGRVRAILAEETERYRAYSAGQVAGPVVAALRARAEELRRAEVGRVAKALGPQPAQALDAASRALVAKLLHEPTVRLKEAAGTPRGDRLAEALRSLFGL